MPNILVVIPTFNERANIGALIDAIMELPENIHALVVDDHSPDGTSNVVREKKKRYSSGRLMLIDREGGKCGRGTAVLRGLKFALEKGYSSALEMDADFSHDPKDIPRLIEKLSEADVVVGSKYVKGGHVIGWKWYRHVLSRAANLYARMILRMPIKDYTNGFRCYGERALKLIPELEIDGVGFTVIPQISYQLHKNGMTFKEIPIIFANRRVGESNMSFAEMQESFHAIIAIRSPRLARHIFQFFKFAVTGVINTCIDVGLLIVFQELTGLALRPSVVLSKSIAITNAFIMNKHWTFKDGRKKYVSQYLQFILVYGSSLVIGVASTLFFAEFVGLYYVIAAVLSIPVTALWNYAWMHFGIFRSETVESHEEACSEKADQCAS